LCNLHLLLWHHGIFLFIKKMGTDGSQSSNFGALHKVHARKRLKAR
jgi:hypothetical protein